MNIRREVSTIIGYTIPKKGWKKAFRQLSIEGRVVEKHLIQIITLLLEKEEEREKD